MFCACGLLFGQHDAEGRVWELGECLIGGPVIYIARCKKFRHHSLPIPACGPGCQNGGKCWDK